MRNPKFTKLVVNVVRSSSWLSPPNETLKSVVIVINKDSLINQLQIREFKEEYYVSQLGIQSDWLILYISILFVITGLVGYTSFVNTINQIDTKVDNAINEQEKKHALHVNEFRALKIQHFDSVSNISQMASATFFKEGLTYEALKNGLISVVYKIQAIKISNKKAYNEKLLSLAIHNLKSGLDMLNLIRKNDAFEQFFLEMANYDELRPILDEILKFENREIKDIVVDIASTLKKMFTQSE